MTVIATWTALTAVFDLGMGTLIIRERALSATDAQIARILQINARTNLAVLLSSGMSLLALAWATSSTTLLHCLPLALWFAAEKNGEVWLGLATAQNRAHLSTLSLLIRRGGALALFMGLLELWAPTIAFSLASVTASVAGNCLIRALMTSSIDRTGSMDIPVRLLVAKARPFYTNSIASQLRQFDLLVVQLVAGPLAAAAFAVPSRLMSPLRLAASAAAPSILKSSASGEQDGLRVAIRLSLMIQTAMTLCLALVATSADTTVPALLGESYASASTPVRVACIGLVFAIGVSLQTAILQGVGREGYVGRLSMLVAPASLLMIGTGASLGGATGAAWGLTIGFILHSTLLMPPLVKTATNLGAQ